MLEFSLIYNISIKFLLNLLWMDDLQFYVLFNSISVKSGKWLRDNEKLCAMEPRYLYGWKDSRLKRDLNPGH